tara:strand:+ start:10418 stop:11476 length:1059 start_codon:yes stop_codon:yes gene_type:complete
MLINMQQGQLSSHTIKGDSKFIGGLMIVLFCSSIYVVPFLYLIVCVLVMYNVFEINNLMLTSYVLSLPVVLLMFDFRHVHFMCDWLMKMSGWFDKGCTIWYNKESIEKIKDVNGSLWCYHPHNISFPFGFALNGAVRYKTSEPSKFVPSDILKYFPKERIQKMTGVQAKILFQTPFVKHVLQSFGCCNDCSKQQLLKLFQQRCDVGIVPGGVDEMSRHKYGHEIVYIKKRKGFIKYAIQHGYTLVVAYTFGESEMYSNINPKPINKIQQKIKGVFGFCFPIFCGKWYCPMLPKNDKHGLNTVLSDPIELPMIPNPTQEDIDKFHQLYVDTLVDIFEKNKSRFGCENKQLEIY